MSLVCLREIDRQLQAALGDSGRIDAEQMSAIAIRASIVGAAWIRT